MIEIFLCVFAVYGMFCAAVEIYFMFVRSSCAAAVFLTQEDTEASAKEKIRDARERMVMGGVNNGPVIINCGATPEVIACLEKECYRIFK